MQTDSPRKKPMSPFIKALKGIKEKVVEAAGPERSEKPKWYDYRLQTPSARHLRRIKSREVDRTTKRYHRRQLQAAVEIAVHNERVSVKVLKGFEAASGLPQGGLRESLIAHGKLQATEPRIVGWEVVEVPTGDVRYPMTSVRRPVHGEPRRVGHTPTQILEAAGLTPEKIQELNELYATEGAK